MWNTTNIDQRAVIDETATIEDNVSIGPYTVIGPYVKIDKGCRIGSHVVIGPYTHMGENNDIYHFSSIGDEPQDIHYKGQVTYLKIGNGNIIREFCTLNRGTYDHRGETVIGDNNMFMAYVHIAHDCIIGNHVLFINNASLAGHVNVRDHAVVGAFVGIHQFTTIGSYSFLARAAMVGNDVPPFIMVAGNPASVYGLNSVGLKRAGFDHKTILRLREAYKILYRQGLKLDKAMEQMHHMEQECPQVRALVQSLQESQVSKRGIIR